MATMKVKHAAAELLRLEDERAALDGEIKRLRGLLVDAMGLDDTVEVDGRVLAKRERVNWEVSPADVYAEVGPRKFLRYVKSVSVPQVREDLGLDWLKKNGNYKVTPYVTWD